MEEAAKRGIDVCPSALTGWLSGFAFLPPFGRHEDLFTDSRMREATETYFRALSRRLNRFPNFLGFDLGNEINCCWRPRSAAEGDAWFHWIMDLVEELSPGRVHVNGVDNAPWFEDVGFSPRELAGRQRIVALHCWVFFTGALKRSEPLGMQSVRLAAAMTALAKAFAEDAARPVWVQEFGASREWMPESVMPEFLERTVDAAVKAGASWFTWWCSHDLARGLKFDTLEYDLGLIGNDRKIKEHGKRFAELARRYRGQEPPKVRETYRPLPLPLDHERTWAWLEEWMKKGGAQ